MPRLAAYREDVSSPLYEAPLQGALPDTNVSDSTVIKHISRNNYTGFVRLTQFPEVDIRKCLSHFHRGAWHQRLYSYFSPSGGSQSRHVFFLLFSGNIQEIHRLLDCIAQFLHNVFMLSILV